MQYEYEKKLIYKAPRWIEPDFTITINGTKYYWEHLGMIGTETYDKRWIEKKAIYTKFFPDKLKITYESAVLTRLPQ
jgi:ATP-dependent DNA helicase RecQ